MQRPSTRDRVRAFPQALTQSGAIEQVHEVHRLVMGGPAPQASPLGVTEREESIRDTLDLIEGSEDDAPVAA